MKRPASSSAVRSPIATFAVVLAMIVLLGLLFRLHRIDTPLADWHSFRQADTASVTREYVKHGIDLLRPKYQDLGNIQSGVRTGGKDNVEGWRMVEFPLVNAVIALTLRTFPGLDLVITSRIFSILASLTTIVALAYLGKNLHSQALGLLSALLYALIPYIVFYSRVILPEPYLVSSVTISLCLFSFALKKEGANGLPYLVASAVCFALALLLKPMAVFFVPAFVGVMLVVQGIRGLRMLWIPVVFGISLIPLVLWRQWISQFPSGIPASDWLFNGDGIRLRPAWFRWLFWERLTKMMLGFAGLSFFAVGVVNMLSGVQKDIDLHLSQFKKNWHRSFSFETFLFLWGVGMLVYLIVFATGNVRHDYYQAILGPFLCTLLAYGILWVWTFQQLWIRAGVIGLLLIGWFFSWQQIKGFYNINHPEIMVAGKAVDRLTPQDAKVIAPYMSDTAFLFQTNRTGWPIGGEIEKKIREGATYYVSVNYDDEARALEKKYRTVEKSDEYIILDLTQEGRR